MKIMLTIVLCSTIANTCLDPHTFPKVYDNYYDCLLDGYKKSYDKIEFIQQNTNYYMEMGPLAHII